jgi:hypothetical protein
MHLLAQEVAALFSSSIQAFLFLQRSSIEEMILLLEFNT